ncbi:MAG: hypothetical protein RIS70_1566 [Planctomycetota bacterium]|jgi:release factor glutamine methyltransferase
MSQAESWTIGRLLVWTTDFLKRHGADSPRLDAEVLLAHVRGCERIQLYTAYEEVASEESRAAFRELVKQRSQGTPVAYLVGRREFYSLSFRVTRDVLIPRPETEFVVMEVLDLIKSRVEGHRTEEPHAEEPVRIADVGTGSGAIAVSIAKHAPHARVLAIDISEPALDVARVNIAEHQVADRVELLHSDLLAAVPAEDRFDVIASNPPYVRECEIAELARDVRDYEPHLALVAGPTGMEIFQRLVGEAARRLVSGGWLVMEIHPQLDQALRELFQRDPGWSEVGIAKDLAGLPRVIKARWRP